MCIYLNTDRPSDIKAVTDAYHRAGHELVAYLAERRRSALPPTELRGLSEAVATIVVALANDIDNALRAGMDCPADLLDEHINWVLSTERWRATCDSDDFVREYLFDDDWVYNTVDYILANHWDALQGLATAFLVSSWRSIEEIHDLLDIIRPSHWSNGSIGECPVTGLAQVGPGVEVVPDLTLIEGP